MAAKKRAKKAADIPAGQTKSSQPRRKTPTKRSGPATERSIRADAPAPSVSHRDERDGDANLPVGPPVAGLVASAGGLDAFKKFFASMPPDSGIAFVLVPHLDPQHESLMVELLARHTAMPVVEVTEAMPVQANHVYVIPPNKYMTISGGVLCLTGPVRRGDWQTSIDSFLRSLASDQQERAICVILSGTGAHGALGLKAIKAAGGMAMVQDTRTADMPQSAISTGLADHVLALNEELHTVNNQLHDKVSELEATNNDLANLLNCTEVATVFLDTQFKIRRFTSPANQLFNLISTDLGRPLADITRKFADPDLLADAGQVLRELIPREREVRTEGDRWWIRRVLPYRTLDDCIEGVAITFVEITERRKSADIMVRRHAAVVENSADAIFSKDLDGTIRSWNRGAVKLYGYSIEEAVGRSVKMLLPTDRLDEWTQAMNQLARGQYIEQLETVRIRKDGQRVAVSLTISPIRDADGNVASASVISRDMTERKRIEEELRRTAAERKRLEGQIVEIVLLEQQRLGAELHDGCGQDLTALGILAGGLIESLKAHSPSDVEVARKIGDGLKHVLQCIRDKAQGLSKASILPRELPGLLEVLTSRLAEKSEINWTYDDHEAVAVHDDFTATQLYHIAQEACTNALKHADAKNVRVSLHLHDAHLILRIEDDGIGIPAESKDGLGMRIMQNRAAVIGGKLTVEPRQPAGTIVTCTLPVEHEHGGR
jgi:two-component system CheB/CheR fusion protein